MSRMPPPTTVQDYEKASLRFVGFRRFGAGSSTESPFRAVYAVVTRPGSLFFVCVVREVRCCAAAASAFAAVATASPWRRRLPDALSAATRLVSAFVSLGTLLGVARAGRQRPPLHFAAATEVVTTCPDDAAGGRNGTLVPCPFAIHGSGVLGFRLAEGNRPAALARRDLNALVHTRGHVVHQFHRSVGHRVQRFGRPMPPSR